MLAALESFYHAIYEGLGLPLGEWIFGNSSIRSFFWGLLDQIMNLFRETPSDYFTSTFGAAQTSIDWLASVLTYGVCIAMASSIFVVLYKTLKRLISLTVH